MLPILALTVLPCILGGLEKISRQHTSAPITTCLIGPFLRACVFRDEKRASGCQNVPDINISPTARNLRSFFSHKFDQLPSSSLESLHFSTLQSTTAVFLSCFVDIARSKLRCEALRRFCHLKFIQNLPPSFIRHLAPLVRTVQLLVGPGKLESQPGTSCHHRWQLGRVV